MPRVLEGDLLYLYPFTIFIRAAKLLSIGLTNLYGHQEEGQCGSTHLYQGHMLIFF